jgi:uncharacterized cupin superfamily protein
LSDVVVRRLDEFEILGRGVFHKVRAGLGVTSFGINVEKWPAGSEDHPEHDEAESGQEEVYTALEGQAFLLAEGQEFELVPGVFARIGPGVRRKIVTRESPVTLLCLGGVPGGVYEPSGS